MLWPHFCTTRGPGPVPKGPPLGPKRPRSDTLRTAPGASKAKLARPSELPRANGCALQMAQSATRPEFGGWMPQRRDSGKRSRENDAPCPAPFGTGSPASEEESLVVPHRRGLRHGADILRAVLCGWAHVLELEQRALEVCAAAFGAGRCQALRETGRADPPPTPLPKGFAGPNALCSA